MSKSVISFLLLLYSKASPISSRVPPNQTPPRWAVGLQQGEGREKTAQSNHHHLWALEPAKRSSLELRRCKQEAGFGGGGCESATAEVQERAGRLAFLLPKMLLTFCWVLVFPPVSGSPFLLSLKEQIELESQALLGRRQIGVWVRCRLNVLFPLNMPSVLSGELVQRQMKRMDVSVCFLNLSFLLFFKKKLSACCLEGGDCSPVICQRCIAVIFFF